MIRALSIGLAALATAAFAIPIKLPARAAEYHKTWEDGALRQPSKKGFKAKLPKSKATTERELMDLLSESRRGTRSGLKVTGKGGKAGPKWSDIELKRGR
jgi:hypothetical protein